MKCNILLMGLTGVGKSSLINYLADKEVAESGIPSGRGGLTRGIHKYPINLNAQECIVSDTEGLETTETDSWHEMISKELLASKSSNQISDWYHIVVYCIGANGGRVQDIELRMIEQIVNAGYGIVVAFTKADLSTDEELSALECVVKEHFNHSINFSFVPVCSKNTKIVEQEGKEQLAEAIIEAWGNSIKNLLPEMIYKPISYDLGLWYEDMREWIEAQNLGLFGRSEESVTCDINEKILNEVRSFENRIVETKKKAFKDIETVYKMLNLVICSDSFLSENLRVLKKIDSLGTSFSSGKMTKVITTLGRFYLNLMNPLIAILVGKVLKERIKKNFEESFNKIYELVKEDEESFRYWLENTLAENNS